MKKAGLIFSAFLLSGIISGQQPFDAILKAKAMINKGKADQAVEILTSALKDNKDSRLLTERAEAYILTGDFQDAIADLNSANSLTPSSGDYGLAQIYAMKGDAVTSLYHLRLSLKSTFKKSEKEVMLDPAFNKIDNRAEWRSFWKDEWYSDLEERMSEIEYYISTRNISDAEAVYSDIRKLYADREEVIYAGAEINLSSGKYAEAIKSLTGLLTSEPGNEKYLRTMAKAQSGALNYAGASVWYSKLINQEVPDAELLIMRAECYRKTGETEKARSDIGKYLSIYPEDQKALSMAGKVEAETGNYLKALEYFSENLKLHPNEPACYIDRANTYLVSRSWDWAIKDYSMSLDLDPGNSDAWLNKGVALVSMDKATDACHDFRMALSLGNKRATEFISRYCIK